MFKPIVLILSLSVIFCQSIPEKIGNLFIEDEIDIPPKGDYADKVTNVTTKVDITYVAVTHDKLPKINGLLLPRLGGDDDAQAFIDDIEKYESNSMVEEPIMDPETKVITRFFSYSYRTEEKAAVFILKYTTTPTINQKYDIKIVQKCHVKKNGETECEDVEEKIPIPYEYDEAYIEASDYLSLQCLKTQIETFKKTTYGTYNSLETCKC